MTKPRLSMKLLWKWAYDFRDAHKNIDAGAVTAFLMEVEEKMRTLPVSKKKIKS